ncbi:hypothetical protein [Streptomyces formicae]|uniref:Putative integral membrane protein n=1 Tax=Streptomyces formicae TaxID=1616117 RepID=A0A291QAJ6_9ACTN|nr:hypothetical protein [Streptomyces formicae]ATL28503.1 putative integral membrane protein [Streptomyces formicae]
MTGPQDTGTGSPRTGPPRTGPLGTTRLIAADVLRRLHRYVWPPQLTQQPRNRAYLRDRMIALPLLTVVAAASFGWAYAEVRADSAALRDSLTPALVSLADAEMSLRIADREAGQSLAAGDAVRLGGLSDRYRTRTARATQSLNQVARSGALTTAERQDLDVISGLVVDYGNWIAFAQSNVGDPALRDAGLSYARSMLCSAPATTAPTGRNRQPGGYPPCPHTTGSDATAVVDRIATLERSLRGRLADRAAPGARVLVAGFVAALALALLGCGLWRTQLFLHHRFRLRVSVPLLVAAAPLLAVPFLTTDAVLAQRAQQRVTDVADELSERTSPRIESTRDERPFGRPHPLLIDSLASRAQHELATGRLPALDGAAPWILPTGLLTAALTVTTLHTYRREYTLITRSGATA